MATVNSAFNVSGGATALQRQSLGQLSAASSTSGSISTASAGYWFLEEQSLDIDYIRIPKYNFATDHTLSLSAYTFASTPTPPVLFTELIFRSTAWYRRTKIFGAFAGSYMQPQKFALYTTSAPDPGIQYTHSTLSGTLGPAGKIETSSTYYNRRPWVDATDIEHISGEVTQFNFYPSVSAHPWMSDEEKASFTSSIGETNNLFTGGTTTYVAHNMDQGWNSIGLPTHQNVTLINPIGAMYLWGIYNPGQESAGMTLNFIDHVGNKMTTGSQYVPSMIPHLHSSFGNIHHIPEYGIWRHDYTNNVNG